MPSTVEKLLQYILDNEVNDVIPQSRMEEYLNACLRKSGSEGIPDPISRVDVLMHELAEQAEYAIPTNIRAGVTIFGVEGNLEPDKPDQNKTVTPTESQQIVRGDTGYELAQVTVEAIQTEEKTVTENGEVTPAEGKYLTKVTVNVPPTPTQEKSTTLTANGTYYVTPDSGKVLSQVTVNVAIPEYDGEVNE